MVEKDVKAIKSAIESMKASKWENKNETIKQLEESLDAQLDELTSGSYSTGYEEAQTLIKSSDWGESEKEHVLKLLSEINDAEQVEEREGQKARIAAIQKMIAKDPLFLRLPRLPVQPVAPLRAELFQRTTHTSHYRMRSKLRA